MRGTSLAYMIVAMAAFLPAGCRQVGPRSILADRNAYNEAILRSWKEETLLNLVRLRYCDTPYFFDVTSVVGGYEAEKSASADFSYTAFPFTDGDNLGPGVDVGGSFINKPTISYAPRDTAEYMQHMAIPLAPSVLFSMVEAGYPVDKLFRLAVESINGIHNAAVSHDAVRPANPKFAELLDLLRSAQLSGALSMRILQEKDEPREVKVQWIEREDAPQSSADLARIRAILGLDPDANEYSVAFGQVPKDPQEIAVETRSIFSILIQLAADVDVPAQHLAQGRAAFLDRHPEGPESLFHVFCSEEEPPCPFAAVCYRGHWFWVDDRDLSSKRIFIHLKMLLALAHSDSDRPLPVVTISAN